MIHHGDCLDVMATLEPESVDAVVTDPPYLIGFMGKHWDGPASFVERKSVRRAGTFEASHGNHNPTDAADASRTRSTENRRAQTWHEAWAREAFRVAKPGAHLLAFGGTRTYHRLASAIEDAGWEIRDCLVWAYAQGFPKSHNVRNDARFCHCEPTPEHDVHPLWDADVPEARSDGPRVGPLLFASVSEPRLSAASVQPEEGELWAGEWGVEGRGDTQAAKGQLRRGPARPRAGVGVADGPQGRLHPGAPASDGRVGGSPAGSVGDGEPRRSQPIEQRPDEPRPVADERGAQAWRGWPVCPRCSQPQVDGLGTALKPAWEPIVMARKPLRGTVAANVLAHGTGALNIDGTRIGPPLTPEEIARSGRGTDGPIYGARTPIDWKRNGRHGEASAERRYPDEPGDFAALPGPRGGDAKGRWPANVILTDPIFDGGIEGVVGGGVAGMGDRDPAFYGDSGTYSRFFLIPKADRAEREPIAGSLTTTDLHLNGAFAVICAKCNRQKVNVPGAACQCAEPEWVRRSQKPRANVHPTVKPVDLMRHLVRLVTPSGGLVLDPFLGSGTTGIACEMEGFDWIGIEREAEYVAIAEARLVGVQKGLGLSA